MGNKGKLKPKKQNISYLRGWFLVPAQGDYKEAKKMAEEYLRGG